MTPLAAAAPRHGGQMRQIAARFGIQAGLLLDLSASINPAGPPLSAIAALQRALANPESLTAYPDLESAELKLRIANCLDVKPTNVSIANGFVPLLEAALRSLRIERCMLPLPCFGEYRTTLERAGVTVIPFQLPIGKDFQYDPDALAKKCLSRRCDAILLANPQNPSGVLCAAEQMKRLLEVAARHNIAVLLDEAFIDYCPDESLIHISVNHSRVIVFRSVTKFFAMPGLRIAYAIGSFPLTRALGRFLAPWPVTSIASDAVCAALLDYAYAAESRHTNQQQRSWLQQELAHVKITAYPSMTNFLLLRFSNGVNPGSVWERMILDHQIVLRSCANFKGLVEGHLRVAVSSKHENHRLVRALKQVLSILQK